MAYNKDATLAVCPYFMYARADDTAKCECAKFTFPDKTMKKEWLKTYCCSESGYKSCQIKQETDKFYERKYRND